MSIYVLDPTEQQQAEQELLAADLVDHFARAGHEARRIRLGTYPGVALWCSGGVSTVILVDADIVQWGRGWENLARWRESTAERIADQVTATLTQPSHPMRGPDPW